MGFPRRFFDWKFDAPPQKKIVAEAAALWLLTRSHFAWLLLVGQSCGEAVAVETSSLRCCHMQGVAL